MTSEDEERPRFVMGGTGVNGLTCINVILFCTGFAETLHSLSSLSEFSNFFKNITKNDCYTCFKEL